MGEKPKELDLKVGIAECEKQISAKQQDSDPILRNRVAGDVKKMEGKYAEAIPFYDATKSNDGITISGLAYCYGKLGMWDKMIALYDVSF